MINKKPELLAPAGSFASAYYAFEAGADGVYFGLKDFSARKPAQNFSFEDLRRLKTLAVAKDKHLYLALNTVIRESEIEKVLEYLWQVNTISINGVIVQDLGVYNILKKYFPNLKIHASTQMAIHNDCGVKQVSKLGFSRVILPRELTIDQIRLLKEKNPDMEFEVFIHGALCYCYSGLCLASWKLTGRSGNRGTCAQICRSLYNMGDDKGYFFSCNDLALYEDVRKLMDIGVDAFKIEGRLKDPEYVYYTTNLYRKIIDGEPFEHLIRDTQLCFLRKTTKGYLNSKSAEDLIDNQYPTHQGVFLGAAKDIFENSFTISTHKKLCAHDGLMFFEDDDIFKPCRFAIKDLQVQGNMVTIFSDFVPKNGQDVYQISSRFLDLKTPNPNVVKPYKVPLDIEVVLSKDEFFVKAPSMNIEIKEKIIIDRALVKRDFKEILKNMFIQSGDSLFCVEQINLKNNTGLEEDSIFIQPSVLKKLKNEFYKEVDRKSSESEGLASQRVKEECLIETLPNPPLSGRDSFIPLTSGDFLNFPPDKGDRGGLSDNCYISLNPIIYDDDKYFLDIQKFVNQNKDKKIYIGLNNISHLEMIKQIKAEHVFYYIGPFLYVANSYSFNFFEKNVKPVFQYFWIEGDEQDFCDLKNKLPLDAPLIRLTNFENIPLFTSKGCFAKHNNLSNCNSCKKDFVYNLTQGKTKCRVEVKNCTTYFYAE